VSYIRNVWGPIFSISPSLYIIFLYFLCYILSLSLFINFLYFHYILLHYILFFHDVPFHYISFFISRVLIGTVQFSFYQNRYWTETISISIGINRKKLVQFWPKPLPVSNYQKLNWFTDPFIRYPPCQRVGSVLTKKKKKNVSNILISKNKNSLLTLPPGVMLKGAFLFLK
jgi:hypothetical protein